MPPVGWGARHRPLQSCVLQKPKRVIQIEAPQKVANQKNELTGLCLVMRKMKTHQLDSSNVL